MAFSAESHSKQYRHINGTASEILDRAAVAELCRGWPVYRDASEWMNFRSIFAKKAFVWTTWSGPLSIEDFIQVSKDGKDKGAWIQHRECGTLVELSRTSDNRAIGKMKAIITQRFNDKQTGVDYDVDCDCRFIFFCQREPAQDPPSGFEWKAHFAKLFYDKDKVVPVDGKSVPEFGEDELKDIPVGYKYLGAAQARLGYKIDTNLPTVQSKETYDRMYRCMELWLDGKDPQLNWGQETMH
jgi:hypothetical protein